MVKEYSMKNGKLLRYGLPSTYARASIRVQRQCITRNGFFFVTFAKNIIETIRSRCQKVTPEYHQCPGVVVKDQHHRGVYVCMDIGNTGVRV